jgi:anthranilate synthase component 1
MLKDTGEGQQERPNLIPVYREILGDMETPISLFRTLDPGKYGFLLESVEGGERWSRYSFMGMEPMFTFQSKGRQVTIRSPRGTQEFQVDDPLQRLAEHLEIFRPVMMDGLPRFYGGAVGYIGYETVSFFEPIPDRLPPRVDVPDTWFMAPKIVLICDNLRQTIQVVYNVHVPEGSDLEALYDQAVESIEQVVEKVRGRIAPQMRRQSAEPPGPIRSRMSREDFESMVVKAKAYIRQGDIIQVVLSQGFEADTGSDPFDVYRVLRRVNPSPYLFYLQFDEVALLGSSPEVMVRLEDGRITLRPIAGTRPRGQTDAQDKKLEEDLLADPKEKAEHVMLVDLARNDVGRVARFNTVQLSDLMIVERYSHVMHIVSNVEGLLKEGLTAFDVLRAAFPAGTVSGAPKVRAMEIIHELEPCRRGPYSGAVGYFGFDGNMDLAITIRSIVMKDSKAYIQAGAGIVADSDPGKEYEETVHKASALFEAVRAEL